MIIALATATGFVLWSFLEYTLHRFAFHERRGANYGSREHLRHHGRRTYHLWSNWPAWAGVLTVGGALFLAGSSVAGRQPPPGP